MNWNDDNEKREFWDQENRYQAKCLGGSMREFCNCSQCNIERKAFRDSVYAQYGGEAAYWQAMKER